MNAAKREAIFARFAAAEPEPAGELHWRTPFELLIAVILSAQATDVSVNRATAGLFAEADTPATMLKLGEAGLKRHIRHIGLYNAKARNVLATCERLLREHEGQVPRQRAALEALPGVGRKTANVVLNVAFDQPLIAVDTHVFRVANRTRLAPGATPLAVERKLARVVPKAYRRHAHHWLILHGRYVCKARRPACASCLIHDLCEYPDKTTAATAA
ncbi:MAG: endonuclease III [Pseudomonadota bacterium]|nr:endonuclease III [Pseudomonadota bacterium]